MTPREQLFVGVDGGGTGCRAVIATADRVLGFGRGGAANVSSDERGAIAQVLAAIAQAMSDAGLDDLSGACAHLGLAGVLTDAQSGAVANEMPFARVAVTDDRPSTLAGALAGKDGFVAAIGTGSFVGSKRESACRYVGGWGLTLSDEASGAWLGREGLAATLHSVDGIGAETDFTREILAQFDNDPNALVAFSAESLPVGFAAVAPRVSAAAQRGDPVATALMKRGAAYIETALDALDFGAGDVLCLTGGLGPSYARHLSPAVSSSLQTASGTALDGALTLARAMA